MKDFVATNKTSTSDLVTQFWPGEGHPGLWDSGHSGTLRDHTAPPGFPWDPAILTLRRDFECKIGAGLWKSRVLSFSLCLCSFVETASENGFGAL